MQDYFSRIKFVLLALALVLFCYADCRILFYLFNREAFPGVGFTGLLSTLFYGLPFDISAILYLNIPFILMALFPAGFFHAKWYRRIAKFFFLFLNGVGILANCSDFAYFEFIHKRTTYDVFMLMTTQADMGELLPLFFIDFWYVFVIAIVFVLFLAFFYNRLFRRYISEQKDAVILSKQLLYKSLVFVFACGLTLLGLRGGFQLIPLGIVNAGDNVSAEKIPIVLNTPFSLMQSLQLDMLEEKKYFTDAECRQLIDPCKTVTDSVPFKPLNVVIILLESFSKEYTGLSGGSSYTPFLDSLMKESYTFVNAYANAKRSIEGIPAVLSATPSMREAYLNTIYNNNKITSIASVLKEKGYQSSFFHGGNKGTMNFDSYCSLAGFDRYYGRTEYGNDADYDGSWGIWDEPFFQRYSEELSKTKQPFVSAVFSLSSHHPFAIPAKYHGVFKEGELPIHKCVSYTDHSVKRFFEASKTKDWFKNTLFVITADHTGPTAAWSRSGLFQVPVLFYQPQSDLRGTDSSVVQQIDIMNGILHCLHYDKTYFSFGNDPFTAKERGYAVNFDNERYQFFWKDYLLVYNDQTDERTYFRVKDRDATEISDPAAISDAATAAGRLKAFIQAYNSSLIRNKMTCE